MAERQGATIYDVFIYLLKNRRLFVVFILTVIPFASLTLAGFVLWWIVHPRLEVSSVGTLSIKTNILGPKISTFLIHPRGWQDTGIDVSGGDRLYPYSGTYS